MSEEAVSPPLPAGWYGKLPSQGDFVWRRLPAEFIQPWDAWLQQGLADLRVELGEEAWLARYLVAPIRRFWLAPGLLGPSGWAGLLMPSVDRVGRHFPLTIATSLQAPVQAVERAAAALSGLAAVLASPQWLASLDQAARRVLDVEFSVEQFESALAGIAPFAVDEVDSEAAMGLACELSMTGDGPTTSIWWCEDATRAAQFLRFCALPPPEVFEALLSDPSLLADSHFVP